MFTIANYQRNVHQNYNKVSLLTSQTSHHLKSTYNKCWRRCGEKETSLDHWRECKLVQLLWKTVLRFLKTLKIQLPYDPAVLGISPDKTIIQKDICTPMFTVFTAENIAIFFFFTLFTKAKTWKQSKCPSTDK